MGMEIVREVKAGKNDWNTYEIGVKDGHIVIRDDTGHIDFSEEEVDALQEAIDQARRRLREVERSPTKQED